MSNKIYAQTQTSQNYIEDKKITNNQWKVYYLLLSISKFDAMNIEDHRYVYKKEINISQICRDLKIKSTQTFYNAVKRLSDFGLVRDNGYCYLIYYKNYVKIEKDTLSNLLQYSASDEKDIDLLRIYLILKKMDVIAKDNSDKRQFSKRNLIMLLGHNATNSDYYKKINIYLVLLSHWNLIELKTHTQHLEKFGTFIIYHLQRVNDKSDSPDFYINIEAEMQGNGMLEEMYKKLQFDYPDLLKQAI